MRVIKHTPHVRQRGLNDQRPLLQPRAHRSPSIRCRAAAHTVADTADLETITAANVVEQDTVQPMLSSLDALSNIEGDQGEQEAQGEQQGQQPLAQEEDPLEKVIEREVNRRRNFAIISHPDAGKTTLTEKLLLYGGAIHEAGAVKSRRDARQTTSDWMALERQRGISISSTAMTFGYSGYQINLLDTPGHQDFSEDTYRTLAAADNAVMLVDGAKGVETQTRKLYEVARMRKLPIFTFVNKMDRPALSPYDIVEQLEKEFGMTSFPITWPIGSGDQFVGLLHRTTNQVHLFKRGKLFEKSRVTQDVYDLDDPALAQLIEPELLEQLHEDVELLGVLGEELDEEEVLAGRVTPMFFGSAANNFGMELFLKSFVELAQRPGPMSTVGGDTLSPLSCQFSGLVFKLQANMDPKHRDKVAFVRVVSGKFEKGMKAKVARTGRVVSLSRPQKMFANDRSTVQEGFAGDVIGLSNPGAFAIGDTLHIGPLLRFPPIPSFSPELFAYLRAPPSSRKAFNKGVEGLLGEGAVQVLYSCDEYVNDPILAAVGQLQFEVVQYRMKDEYGVETSLDPLPFALARWVPGGWEALERAGRLFNTQVVKDVYGRPVILFRNTFALTQVLSEKAAELGDLSPTALPPDS